MRCFGNLFVGRQTFTWTKSQHTLKAGAEFRANRDTTYFGTGINGMYVFGGGTSYAPVAIRSLSGANNIAAGAPLPDTLSALLTASLFSYGVAVAPPQFPQGDQIAESPPSLVMRSISSSRIRGKSPAAWSSITDCVMKCTGPSRSAPGVPPPLKGMNI